MIDVIFFSLTGNTRSFAKKVDPNSRGIVEDNLINAEIKAPFILIMSTYSDGNGRHAVPTKVSHFLRENDNYKFLKGVVGCGDRNFGPTFCKGGRDVARQYRVPFLHELELFGTPTDITTVKRILDSWMS